MFKCLLREVQYEVTAPCVTDRALQRSVPAVLGAIYEQGFMPCSFGGRPGLGAHDALATLGEILSRPPAVSYVLDADLKNYFGSLDHGWLLRFLEDQLGDPRIKIGRAHV